MKIKLAEWGTPKKKYEKKNVHQEIKTQPKCANKFLRRLNVKNNAYSTFELLKTAAIRKSNFYYNLQSPEK